MIDREALEVAATAVMERRIKPDMPALLGKHWVVDHDKVLAEAAITAYLTALASPEGAQAGEVCGVCGQPWIGRKCDKDANGWPHPSCYPTTSPTPSAQAGEVVKQWRARADGVSAPWHDGAAPEMIACETRTLYTAPPAPDDAVRAVVEDPCELDDCPVGLFQAESGNFGFMTEYSTLVRSGAFKSFRQRDAYVVESGEYFWGGTSDPVERSKLKVRPVTLIRARKGGAR